MILDVPPRWHLLAQQLAASTWRRLVVLGSADRGKSSFCHFLGDHLTSCGLTVGLLDTDLGQKMIGTPGCVTLGVWSERGELECRRMAFIGAFSPAASMPAVIAGSARLADAPGVDRLIVNTSGLVAGPGIPLKRWKLEALNADHIIAIASGGELASVLDALAPVRLHRIAPSAAARRKSPSMREMSRRSGLAGALRGARLRAITGLVSEELERALPPADALRLCGLADEAGENRGVGLVRVADFEQRREVWTNLEPTGLRRIRFGMALPEDWIPQESYPGEHAGPRVTV